MASQHGMVLPQVDPISGSIDADDLADVRIPARLGRFTDNERAVYPVGYYDGQMATGGTARMITGPCNPTGTWGSNRHLFDALMTTEGDRYDADDNLAPSAFRLALTCVRCGVVRELRGQLDPSESDRSGGDAYRGRIDPVPLQAGPLLAQEVSRAHVWGDEWNVQWTVYAQGRRVGWMATERGQRGRRYVAGGLGRRYLDDHPVVKGPSPLAVLRKMAKVQVSELVPAP